jgi:hypothetical protein
MWAIEHRSRYSRSSLEELCSVEIFGVLTRRHTASHRKQPGSGFCSKMTLPSRETDYLPAATTITSHGPPLLTPFRPYEALVGSWYSLASSNTLLTWPRDTIFTSSPLVRISHAVGWMTPSLQVADNKPCSVWHQQRQPPPWSARPVGKRSRLRP